MKKYQKISEDELVYKILHSQYLKDVGFRLCRSEVQQEFNQFWRIDIKKLVEGFASIQKMIEDLEYQNEELICDFCGEHFLRKHRDSSNKSGRNFCSDLCSKQFSASFANTEEKRIQKSKTLKRLYQQGKLLVCGRTIDENKKIFEEYNSSPKECPICGNPIPYEKRNCETCSTECSGILNGKHNHETQMIRHSSGGKREGSGRGKRGWYKGYYCDSSWELAWVIYNLDHGNQFKRNTNIYYEYEYGGQIRKYFPDFIMSDGEFVEIKGYSTDQWLCKLNSLPSEVKINVLYKTEIKPFLKYVIEHYGNDFVRLYDNSKPNEDLNKRSFIFINKNDINKCIKPSELEKFKLDGWVKGRTQLI